MQATMISHGSGQRLLKQLLESRGEGCAAEEAGGRCRLQGGSRRVLWGPQQQRQAVRSQQQRQQQWQQQQQQAVQQVERRADDALGLADLVDSQVDQDRKAEPLLAMTFRTFEKVSAAWAIHHSHSCSCQVLPLLIFATWTEEYRRCVELDADASPA